MAKVLSNFELVIKNINKNSIYEFSYEELFENL
jgi:hypothetical protein